MIQKIIYIEYINCLKLGFTGFRAGKNKTLVEKLIDNNRPYYLIKPIILNKVIRFIFGVNKYSTKVNKSLNHILTLNPVNPNFILSNR